MSLPRAFHTIPLAHRGLHDVNADRPENSRAAFRAAIDAGYGIELDVQLTADNAAMVFHDYALERLTNGTGPVRLRSAEDLAGTRLKGGQEGIPPLADVLDLVAGRVPLLIELKDQDGGMGPDIGPLEAAVASALEGYEGPVAVMSFNPHSVARMADLLPEVPRGIVTSAYRYEDWPLPRATCDALREVPDFDRVDAAFISHELDDLARPRVAEIKAGGAFICCWTIRDVGQEMQARKVADNITFEGYMPAIPA
ncbi:Glycerophosphoryl diester phosphodiesterase [Sulfitobacter sp. THAF37]|uniref:glycerophosphodiester phosphodiesterase family protein n=1 Tax=Sulfitobacter sp. THAF37 TaxID=2587855 RepID=UPI0012685E65|nr:glycerophosphodiester phosphodiesterase family protein [Sulfitobacter sp. THAF37]QFT57968.1 Glycerophosphoryl diester phosphodiesterase [Sulfitobacter sp. THAF37]